MGHLKIKRRDPRFGTTVNMPVAAHSIFVNVSLLDAAEGGFCSVLFFKKSFPYEQESVPDERKD